MQENTVPRNLKALALAQQKYGENHSIVATSYNNLGLIYAGLEEHDKALEPYKQALKILLQVHGKNHEDPQEVLESLIACTKKASPLQVKKLQDIRMLCTQVLGEQNSWVQQLKQLVDLSLQ